MNKNLIDQTLLDAPTINPKVFHRILRNSVTFPLILSSVLTAIFIGLIFHLISVIRAVDHVNHVISQAHETIVLLVDSETGQRLYLITGKEELLETYYHSIQSVDRKIEILKNLSSNYPIQTQRLDQVKSLLLEWKNYSQGSINFKRQGNNEYLKRVASGNLKRKLDEVRNQFSEFIRFEEILRDNRSKTAEETIRLVILGILIFSGLAGIFLAFYSRKQLKSLSGSFSSVLQKHSELTQKLLYEDWLRTGLFDLNALSHGEVNLSELTSKIINYLAKYTGAQIGSLYVASDEGILRRFSTYAFSSEAEAKPSEIKFKEGLVGQAAAENRLLQITNLPENYIQVTSSLGTAIPRALLVAPAFAEGSVKAVLELGFLSMPEPRVIELLERASSGIALSIRSRQHRAQIQSLLENAMTLNDELQTQQEELKAANEELEEQTHTLEQQRNSLNKNNEALESAQILLKERSEEVQKSSQYKSEFLANMSHELRTPLNSLLILSKLLADNSDGNLTQEQLQYVHSINTAGNDLLDLIKDILDLSKVEAGKLEIRIESVFLPKLISDLEKTFILIAKEKNLKFQIKTDQSVPETIFTDRQRLEQILKNLLSNALKFTEKGQVTLHVSLATNGKISFSVIDTGIGISKDQLNVIFEAFRQADGTNSRKYGGTGLGLSISRDLSTLLRGSIEVESVLGEGSRFTLLLPESYNSSPAPEQISSPQVERIRALPFSDDRNNLASLEHLFLVIEDDVQFARILFELAHKLHHKCVVALDAKEGLELSKNLLPSAILLDINLPDHSGLAVLDQLKENLTTRHIPVHIMSVHDYMEKAYQMGAIGYVLKPAKYNQLKDAFAKIESKLSQKIKRILIVEDDKLQRESIVKLISDPNVEITAVALAREALDALEKTVYDCMVIDLKLPDMSGEHLLKKMTEQEKLASFPPVIVYTGRSLSRDEEDQLRKYSRSIIIKGAKSPERLLDEVSLFLHCVESLSPEGQEIIKLLRNCEDIFEDKKILIVDDDVRNVFAMTSILEKKGATIVVARSGKEALIKLDENPLIDLVLMDIMMPEMDGLEATREIRKQKRFATLPIIAVTAKATKKDKMLCMEAGANDYLAKPIDAHLLLSLIRVWISKLGKD